MSNLALVNEGRVIDDFEREVEEYRFYLELSGFFGSDVVRFNI